MRCRGTRPPAQPSRPAARAPAGRDRQACQSPAAPPDGAAEPRLGIRPRRGHPRRRTPHPRRHQPDARFVVQDRARHQFPRHRGLAADRQFRIDARAADHGGGDERRHPRPHPRALRREGRDPGLHDARLEGRPEPRAVARRRQTGQSRPPQRPAPHRLQAGRRPVAPCPQEPGPDAARGHPQGEHRRRGAAVGAQPPAAAPRRAQDHDGDLRRRAGR